MKSITILDPGFPSYTYEQSLFQQHGFELRIREAHSGKAGQGIEFACNSEGILVRGTRLGEKELEMLPGLKAIVRYGVGYDNVDLEAAKKRGIRVANVRGYADHAVSDHALALLFACIRGFGEIRSPTKGIGNSVTEFGRPAHRDVFELHDKTLGIIGIGRIGSCLSLKAVSLFREILAFDPYKDKAYMHSCGARKVLLPEVLEKSHVVSIHCNLTDETKYMFDNEAFDRTRKRPVIINTSRGPVIREPDLLAALNSGKLHSAGLDVFEKEPPGPGQKALIDHPRVIVTPHIAWYSETSQVQLQKRAADNLISLLKDEPVEDEL